MPKTYSEEEKKEIIKALKQAAAESMKNKGVVKTSVNALVETVGIPKGTFYLFFESKDLLLYETMMDVHREINEKLFTKAYDIKDDVTIEKVTEILADYYISIAQTCLYSAINSGELGALMERIPAKEKTVHESYDNKSMDRLFDLLGMNKKTRSEIEKYSGALRAIFAILQYRESMGQGQFEQTLYILIRGILIQLFEGEDMLKKVD